MFHPEDRALSGARQEQSSARKAVAEPIARGARARRYQAMARKTEAEDHAGHFFTRTSASAGLSLRRKLKAEQKFFQDYFGAPDPEVRLPLKP